MPDSDRILATAQIGMAGSPAVSVLGRPGVHERRALDEIRLRSMVELSFLLVAFRLLPLVAAKFGVSPGSVWRWTAAPYAAAFAGRPADGRRWLTRTCVLFP